MSWQVIWSPKAAKYLEDLPKDTAKRILGKFDGVAIDPFRHLEHFEGAPYKIRIGNYRALVDVEFDKKVLKVRVLDKRERIY